MDFFFGQKKKLDWKEVDKQAEEKFIIRNTNDSCICDIFLHFI